MRFSIFYEQTVMYCGGISRIAAFGVRAEQVESRVILMRFLLTTGYDYSRTNDHDYDYRIGTGLSARTVIPAG